MNDYIVPEKNRIKLGKYLKDKREINGFGLNQLAIKVDVVSSLLSRLENGKVLKINPFLLKKIAEGLRIDYKELYKIVGYLNEEDFEKNKYEEKLKEMEKQLKECNEKLTIQNNNNNGHIIIGNGNNIKKIYGNTELAKELNELDDKQKEKVLKFINEYIK
ncbi:hypothetical protein SAMN02745174_02070 [Cetobacterium ceti]|uniref:HTH cro/C1-type domain-containing protein n=1 Tax=Cetobacterium ceti TaxID=180163 RepID=A0A1T4PVQ2_9FUSO|nr:helix-turn-helix transcriptional regulator [Cetobacterium ceti]SJZ95605.1 hypothetical protein SAMN02745174_02070 [Cetobacterium ceti]